MNELVHHGIKGQQWGVRNGPPYPLDEKKSAAIKKSSSKEKQVQKSRELSTSELEAIIKRIELENKYVNLTYSPGLGANIAKWAKDTGAKALSKVASDQAAKLLNRLIDNVTKQAGKK